MKTPESSSGLRMARFWNTKASISIPVPATAQPISDPRMPVATPKRAGSEKTPAPTMPPTTIPVRVGTLIFSGVATAVSATGPATRGGGIVSTIVSYSSPDEGSSVTARRVDPGPGDSALRRLPGIGRSTSVVVVMATLPRRDGCRRGRSRGQELDDQPGHPADQDGHGD